MTLSALYDLARQEDVDVDCFAMDKTEAMSCLFKDGSCSVAIDPFRLTSEADEKVKLGHELGHCLTGAFYNRYSDFDLRQRHEIRADRWAIKKLIPKDELVKAYCQGCIEAWQLADYFGVTEDFVYKALEAYMSEGL